MATLDEYGREILDQTPIAIPFDYERPEPIHLRLRRMVEQYHREVNPEFETLDDANDFEIPEDPSSYDSTWTEPDLEPVSPAYQALSDAEIMAAREAILRMRAEQQDAGADGGVSSPPEVPAEPAKPDSQTS